jgi:hypothetical protein
VEKGSVKEKESVKKKASVEAADEDWKQEM